MFDCFKNIFPNNCGIPDFNLPPMAIDDIPCPNKRSRYASDPLSATISVASEKSLGTLTSPCDSPTLQFPCSYIHVMDDNMMKDKTASRTFSLIIVESQISIFLPWPLMIFLAQTKEAVMPLIRYQLPYLLPQKNLLVL